VDEDWLRKEFETCGAIISVRVITERDSGRSKGFGYVEFAAKGGLSACLAKNGTELDGRQLKIDAASARPAAGQKAAFASPGDRAKAYGDTPSQPSDTLFLGNLAFDTDNETVREIFAPYGNITSIRLPTDRETGRPKGFGYVQYGSIDEAKAAFEGANEVEILGRTVRLDYSVPRDPNNSPQGGGRGGFGGGRGGGRGGSGGFGGGRGGGRGGFGGGRGGQSGGGFRGAPRRQQFGAQPFQGQRTTF